MNINSTLIILYIWDSLIVDQCEDSGIIYAEFTNSKLNEKDDT